MPGIDFDAAQKMVTVEQVVNVLGWTKVREGNYVYRCACPIQHHDDPRCTVVNLAEDAWYCHRCEQGGGPFQFYMYATNLPVFDAVRELFERLCKPVPYLAAHKFSESQREKKARGRVDRSRQRRRY